jgi:serine/threonine-protein kinase
VPTTCPSCHAENPETKQFCGDCGTKLTSIEDVKPSVTRTLEITQDKLKRGALFAGRYEIIEELGTGGMGKVYRVEDKKIGEEVALKLIRLEIAIKKR